MKDLQRELLDLLCWDEDSFERERARVIDSDRIDLLEEVTTAIEEAQQDGSWTDERRRRILETARLRALGSRGREASARENVERFLGGLAESCSARLRDELPSDGTLPERVDRSLAGLANAIEGTLPRELRREGSALFIVRRRGASHLGSWTGDHDARGVPMDDGVLMEEVAELQFERLGELSSPAAGALSAELMRLLELGSVAIPGFATRITGKGEFELVWGVSQREEMRPSADIAREVVPQESQGLFTLFSAVAELVHCNFAAAQRDPSALEVEAFVPRVEPESAVPLLVNELAQRVNSSVEEVSGRLHELVSEQLRTYSAMQELDSEDTKGLEQVNKAIARLSDNENILSQLRRQGGQNRTTLSAAQR